MSDQSKITCAHLSRNAFVYIRQSSVQQVVRNRESTDRQYQLVDRAVELGWRRDQIRVFDEDLGVSADGVAQRSGFALMATEVALGHVGMVLGIEVSRLARNNADWYRLLDLCGVTDTLIADADGIYHPCLFNDRLVLGLKGTMSEAELHILRARLNGGIRNKAARGQLRRGLPIGYVWGQEDGEVLLHPDEAVVAAIRTVFERFAEMGSVRKVWLWLRSEQFLFPLQPNAQTEIRWAAPAYSKIHQVLTNPVYGGAYVYGKTRNERYVDDHGRVRKRIRKLAVSEWDVLLPNHHPGYIDWETYQANLRRIAGNIRPLPHDPGGAVREGAALLQGIAVCGCCGRKLAVFYSGRNSQPGYYCSGDNIANGRGTHCLRIGGRQVDRAIANALLCALAPAGLQASLQAAQQLEVDHDAALAQWHRQVERASYEAQRAERRYRAVDPENRLVARGLEAEWEKRLQALQAAQAELDQREQQRPRALTPKEHNTLLALGSDLERVWEAPTTTDCDRKQLLRTLLEEVIIAADVPKLNAHLTLRWKGGLISEIDLSLQARRSATLRTDDDTIDLVRRLATHYPDAIIAGILTRQGRTTVTGQRFNANHVASLRRYWKIPRFEKPTDAPTGSCVTIAQAAQILGIAPSTLHRWLNDGFIAGEQVTPGAPWRICINDHLRSRFVQEAPEGYLPMREAMNVLGVSRQTVLQRVKHGDLEAVHVARGRAKGLLIKVPDVLPDLFGQASGARG